MTVPLDHRENEKAAGITNDAYIPIKSNIGEDEYVEKKKGLNVFLVSLAECPVFCDGIVADEQGRPLAESFHLWRY